MMYANKYELRRDNQHVFSRGDKQIAINQIVDGEYNWEFGIYNQKLQCIVHDEVSLPTESADDVFAYIQPRIGAYC